MNRIGIRAHDIGKFDVSTLAQKVKERGFSGVQLVFKKAFLEDIDFDNLKEIKTNFGSNPQIFMLGAYFNPVHPNKKIAFDGICYFKKHLKIAKELNAQFVGTETGSLMGSPWGYVPANHTDETLSDVIDVFKILTKYAKKHQTYIALEGAWAHVASTPERVKKILDEVDSPYLKVTIDLFNFLNIDNYETRMDIFVEALELLGSKTVIFHLKDFIVKNGQLKQVGLGQGLMDYEKIISLITTKCPKAYLIFEGVTGKDIDTSLRFIKELVGGKK